MPTILLSMLLASWCAHTQGLHNPPKLVKSDKPYIVYMNQGTPSGPVESTPIVFNNEIWTITSNAISGNYQGTFRVDNPSRTQTITINAPDMLYLSAFSENNIVYAFGTSRDHTQINMMLSHDLKSWTKRVTIFTAPAGKGFYNTSLTKNNDLYVMAVETTDKSRVESFVTNFLIGTNLMNLTLTEFFYTNNKFTNCPTLRYFEGYYYLWYMSEYNSQLITFISRSRDLKIWENSSGGTDKTVVPFIASKNEGNNNSDMDIVEFDGQLFFTYAVGDQTSWLELHTAIYPDNLRNYLRLFFT